MNHEFGLVYPLWNADGDADELLERIFGEIGPHHLTVPVITGHVSQVRAFRESGPRVFATRGGWHYPPGDAFEKVTVRPRIAEWFGKRNTLTKLRKAADERHVELFARLDIRAVRALTEQNEHLRQSNAWGEPMYAAGACVSNPDLRTLLEAAIDDLISHGITGYQLVDWRPDHAVDSHGPRPLDWNRTAWDMLDVCFCSSCRQLAAARGVDPDLAATSVQRHIQRAIEKPQDENLAGYIDKDDVLQDYIAIRRTDSDEWLERLANRADNPRAFLVCDATDAVRRQGFAGSHGVILRPGRLSAEVFDATVCDLAKRMSDPLGICLPAWRPMFEHAKQLVSTAKQLKELADVSVIEFEGVELAPNADENHAEDAVTWVRQAARFFRRD